MKSKLVFLYFILIISTCISAEEPVVISGAGPSTEIVTHFISFFNTTADSEKFNIIIPQRSIKHRGGILSARNSLIGRTGRPLNAKEKALGLKEIILGGVPVAIAVNTQTNIYSMTLQNIKDIYTGKVNNWQSFNGPDKKIFIIGREAREAVFSLLKSKYPFFDGAKFDLILKNDNMVIDFIRSNREQMSIAFGTKSYFEQYPSLLRVLEVDGFSAATFVGMVYHEKNSKHPLIESFLVLAKSDEWKKKSPQLGFVASE